MAACFGGMLFPDNLREHIPLFWCLFGAAALCYCLAIRWSGDLKVTTIFAAGILFRVVLLPADPTLSDDVYRYVWDGRVQAAGVNPYRYAPADDALSHLRDDVVHPRVNHPGVPTIYPPAAQLLFGAVARVWPSVFAMKIVVVGFDLLCAWFLVGLLRRFSQRPGQVLIYLWNPLLVVEGAGMGHVDVAAAALMMAALLYLHVDGFGRSASALALSFLTKLFAGCLLPVIWRWTAWAHLPEPTWRSRLVALVDPRRVWPVGVFMGVSALLTWNYADAGRGMLVGLTTYARHWEFNSPVYDGLRWVMDDDTARQVIVSVFGAIVIVLTFARRVPPVQAGYFLTGAFLLLTPTLHPWYALWILPFLAFYRRPAWVAFTLLIPVSYHVLIQYQATGVWEEAMWPRWVLFGGFGLTWILDAVLTQRRQAAKRIQDQDVDDCGGRNRSSAISQS